MNSECSSSEQAVGRACWDRPGASGWDVNEGGATWTDKAHNPSTFNVHETYTVPEEISHAGDPVTLEVTANDVSNNSGIDAQLCVQSPFTIPPGQGASDPCARAFAKTPGSTDTGSKVLTLLPTGVAPSGLCPNGGPGSQPECVTLTVELGDGGNLRFTYQVSAARKISYSFHGSFENRRGEAELSGKGTFELAHTINSTCTPGAADHGSATLRVHKPNGPVFVVGLGSFRADRFCVSGQRTRVDLTYRVTTSPFACLPKGKTVDLELTHRPGKPDDISFDECGLRSKHHDHVTITST